jgi:hypothetical protein
VAVQRYAAGTIERELLSTEKQHWPTWVVVVSIIILIPVLVWVLAISLNILAALSIGGILLIGGVVALFVWGLKSADVD